MVRSCLVWKILYVCEYALFVLVTAVKTRVRHADIFVSQTPTKTHTHTNTQTHKFHNEQHWIGLPKRIFVVEDSIRCR